MVRLSTTNWNNFVSAFPQVESRLIGFDRVFDAVNRLHTIEGCLLYTSDAADDLTRVDLGGRRIIKMV